MLDGQNGCPLHTLLLSRPRTQQSLIQVDDDRVVIDLLLMNIVLIGLITQGYTFSGLIPKAARFFGAVL
jgi:hypothetical protein